MNPRKLILVLVLLLMAAVALPFQGTAHAASLTATGTVLAGNPGTGEYDVVLQSSDPIATLAVTIMIPQSGVVLNPREYDTFGGSHSHGLTGGAIQFNFSGTNLNANTSYKAGAQIDFANSGGNTYTYPGMWAVDGAYLGGTKFHQSGKFGSAPANSPDLLTLTPSVLSGPGGGEVDLTLQTDSVIKSLIVFTGIFKSSGITNPRSFGFDHSVIDLAGLYVGVSALPTGQTFTGTTKVGLQVDFLNSQGTLHDVTDNNYVVLATFADGTSTFRFGNF